MTVSFQNPGEIDLKAAMVFGVSAKVGSNPIGFFGTGLKYAIACILRAGGRVTINSNGKTHSFSVEVRETRGQQYGEVMMSGRGLGFSVMLGRNWEPWQAFRELYCNAKDEGGSATNKALKPRPGYTTIVVSGWEAFDTAYEQRNSYFIPEDATPIYKGSHAEVYKGRTNGIYYRGILIASDPRMGSQYTYNITTPVLLTEDRTMKYPHQFKQAVAVTMLQCIDKNLLEDLLLSPSDTVEGNLSFEDWGVDPSETFLDTVQEIRRGPMGHRLNRNAVDLLDKRRPVADDSTVVVLNDEQREMLEAAVALLEKRFPDIRKVSIIPVATLGAGIYGLARKGKAYISMRCFEAGFDQIVGTVFEEYSHITKGFEDESRDFQNYLMNLVAQLMREKYNG